jgi:transposase
VLTPYLPYLIRRWRETQADSRQLWREMQALGYTHSARTVCRFITQLRRAADAGLPAESQGSPYIRLQGPSARAVSFAMVSPATKRSHEAQMYVDQLCQLDAAIARAHALSEAFLTLVRERQGADLTAWMAEAISCAIAELARFARGLQDDMSAVTAGLTLAWSHGVTEGHIHRLKLLKRQGYGRAGFALLRPRVLHAAEDWPVMPLIFATACQAARAFQGAVSRGLATSHLAEGLKTNQRPVGGAMMVASEVIVIGGAPCSGKTTSRLGRRH